MAGSDDVQRLAVLIEANTKAYERAMARIETRTAKALKAATASAASLDRRMAALGRNALRLAGAFGLTIGTTALTGFITRSIRAGEEIGDLAERIGISAERLQELTFVSEQAGASQEALVTALRQSARFLGDAQRGSKEAVKEFTALGFSVNELVGMTPDQFFVRLADRISKVDNPLQRSALSMKFFGRSGTEMLGVINLGASGIEQLAQRARELGIVMSNETIAKAREAGDILDVLAGVFKTAGVNLATEFLPAINALARLVTSQDFQAGLGRTAQRIGQIIDFFANNPEIGRILLGAAAGFAVGGPVGAVVGGGAVAVGEGIGAAERKLRGPAPTSLADVQKALGIENWDQFTNPVPAALGGDDGSGAPDFSTFDKATDKFKELREELERKTLALTMDNRAQFVANEVARLGIDAAQEHKDAIAELAGSYYDMERRIEPLINIMDTLRQGAHSFFSSLARDVMDGTFSINTLTDALKNLASQMLDTFLSNALTALLGPSGSFGGGIFSSLFGGARAHGGGVSPGRAYVVGENGPEVFMPGRSGSIANRMGGGEPIIQVINTTGEPTRQERGRGPGGRSLVRVIVGEVKKDMAMGGFNGAMGARFGAKPQVGRVG